MKNSILYSGIPFNAGFLTYNAVFLLNGTGYRPLHAFAAAWHAALLAIFVVLAFVWKE